MKPTLDRFGRFIWPLFRWVLVGIAYLFLFCLTIIQFISIAIIFINLYIKSVIYSLSVRFHPARQPDSPLSEYDASVEALVRTIQQLPLSEVENEVLGILRYGDYFQVTRSTQSDSIEREPMAEIGAALHRFFLEFEEVRWGECILVSRHYLKYSAWASDSIRLVELAPANEEEHLVTIAGEDTIWEVLDDVPLDCQSAAAFQYPSIYHWLLYCYRRQQLNHGK